jgi:hypothetical protein
MTHVLYLGNFEPTHSTENHVAQALIANGHGLQVMQENDPRTFSVLAGPWPAALEDVEVILWTRTGWDWNRFYTGGERRAIADQRTMLRKARQAGIPVVGYHLDIWWGLGREHLVYDEPFFGVDLLVTADGGHDDKWEVLGINHHWMPPGISKAQAKLGKRNPEYVSDIAFVGSWQGGYHRESAHRYELVEFLQKNFADRCAFWPKPGQPAVRGKPLQDLYRSVKIAIGDSCFVGSGLANYWSDRIPETLGRGGLLLHPNVPGLEQYFHDGVDMLTWDAFDWSNLGDMIEAILSKENDGLRRQIANQGRANVLKHHTYEVRMEQLWDLMKNQGLL